LSVGNTENPPATASSTKRIEGPIEGLMAGLQVKGSIPVDLLSGFLRIAPL
jgi:hypothetical protein